VEYECHVLKEMLPRFLFDTHPEYFRLDAKGTRTNDLNICFFLRRGMGGYRKKRDGAAPVAATNDQPLFLLDR